MIFNRIHVNSNDIAVIIGSGTTHTVSATEDYTLSSNTSGQYTLTGNVSDNLTLSDVASKIATLLGNISENLTYNDSTSTTITFSTSVFENYSLEDISSAFLGIDGIIGISTTATTITINFITSS